MREIADADRIRRFMAELGRAARSETTVYLVGGACAVLHGWRQETIDADIKIVPESDALFDAIARIKERLKINVELASPDLFIPPLPDWEERSPFAAKEGLVTFRHYDFYAQALAKIERGHERDLLDALRMRELDLIENDRLLELFKAIEPALPRYPALDPRSFRRRVEEFARRRAP